MALNIILPHGRQVDLDGVTVVRTVSEKESAGYNARLAEAFAARPDFNGVVPSRRWTIVLEKPKADGTTETIYASDLSVEKLLAAVPDLARRMQLVDGKRAAVAGRAHLIRPLENRDGSDNRAVIWIEGGSSNGLYVTRTAEEIRAELGQKAAHLVQIGEEGYIDRSRIERIAAFDGEKALEPGQKRFATAVHFKGVNARRPQYFVASAAEIRGERVVDLREEPARPGAGTPRRAAHAPEAR